MAAFQFHAKVMFQSRDHAQEQPPQQERMHIRVRWRRAPSCGPRALLRWTMRIEIVAAVMPGRRDAWPRVPGARLDQALARFVGKPRDRGIVDFRGQARLSRSCAGARLPLAGARCSRRTSLARLETARTCSARRGSAPGATAPAAIAPASRGRNPSARRQPGPSRATGVRRSSALSSRRSRRYSARLVNMR